jgi:hypothetical protein
LISDLAFFVFCEAVPWLLHELFRMMLCGFAEHGASSFFPTFVPAALRIMNKNLLEMGNKTKSNNSV